MCLQGRLGLCLRSEATWEWMISISRQDGCHVVNLNLVEEVLPVATLQFQMEAFISPSVERDDGCQFSNSSHVLTFFFNNPKRHCLFECRRGMYFWGLKNGRFETSTRRVSSIYRWYLFTCVEQKGGGSNLCEGGLTGQGPMTDVWDETSLPTHDPFCQPIATAAGSSYSWNPFWLGMAIINVDQLLSNRCQQVYQRISNIFRWCRLSLSEFLSLAMTITFHCVVAFCCGLAFCNRSSGFGNTDRYYYSPTTNRINRRISIGRWNLQSFSCLWSSGYSNTCQKYISFFF